MRVNYQGSGTLISEDIIKVLSYIIILKMSWNDLQIFGFISYTLFLAANILGNVECVTVFDIIWRRRIWCYHNKKPKSYAIQLV